MQQAFHVFQFRDDNEENISPPDPHTANSVTNDNILALLQGLQTKVDNLVNENKALRGKRGGN